MGTNFDLRDRVEQRETRQDFFDRILYPHNAEVQTMLDRGLNWLVRDVLPGGCLIVLGAPPKTGKSFLLSALARAVVEGKPFLGKQTASGDVIWLNYEESVRERGLSHQSWRPNVEAPHRIWTTDEYLYLDDDETFTCLEHWILTRKPSLLVIDSLHAALKRPLLNENHNARRLMSQLRNLCGHGVTIIVVHHLTKHQHNAHLSDSTQIAASSSVTIEMDADMDPDGTRRFTLRCRGRGNVNGNFYIVSQSPGEYKLVKRHAPDRAKILLPYLKRSAKTSLELALETGLAPASVRVYLAELLSKGLVSKVEKAGSRFKYGVTQPEKVGAGEESSNKCAPSFLVPRESDEVRNEAESDEESSCQKLKRS